MTGQFGPFSWRFVRDAWWVRCGRVAVIALELRRLKAQPVPSPESPITGQPRVWHECRRPGCGQFTRLGTAWCGDCLYEAEQEKKRWPVPRPPRLIPPRRPPQVQRGK